MLSPLFNQSGKLPNGAANCITSPAGVAKAFVEGTNPDVTKRAIAKYMRMKDQKELAEAYEMLDGLTPRKPSPTLEVFKNIIADLTSQIPAARSAELKDFIDGRFLEELDRSGFIDGLYRQSDLQLQR
jgi:hypothetical protein